MPTAGRLAGAILFGLFAWYIATITVPLFPESRAPDWWFPVSCLLGIFMGWKLVGTRAGRGFNPATGIGLTAGPLLAFCMVFSLAFEQMIQNGMRLRYSGPTEAVIDTFSLMAEVGVDFYSINLVATIVIGAVLCAWVTEIFGQRFP